MEMENEEILETTEETREELPEEIRNEPPAPEEPAPELPPEPSEEIPEPDPGTLPVVEVISVDDLLNRLAPDSEEPEEDSQVTEEETVEVAGGEFLDLFDDATVIPGGGPLELVGMDKLLRHLKTIQETAVHPIMTTPFDEYTVTEGLLLLVFVLLLLNFFLNLLRRWF